MTWTAKPVDPNDTHYLDVNILREDGLAVGVAVQNGDISPEEALENAYKMAAAPELLVVAKAVEQLALDALDLDDVAYAARDAALIHLARAAVAKAEGRA